jgi:hypothetical protein
VAKHLREADMEANLDATIALLERTPTALNAMLRGLPDAWTHSNEGGETWSVFDVVGHLIHADLADWLPRARWILEFGESKPFPPFDRSGHREITQGKSLPKLLDELAEVRAQKLNELRALDLQLEDFARCGKHPALGSATLSQLLATWAAHDLNHMHQISRIMAIQYREAVGPWQKYLGVMHCNGHGAAA